MKNPLFHPQSNRAGASAEQYKLGERSEQRKSMIAIRMPAQNIRAFSPEPPCARELLSDSRPPAATLIRNTFLHTVLQHPPDRTDLMQPSRRRSGPGGL